MKRKKPLRADPEKTKAWQQRSRAAAARRKREKRTASAVDPAGGVLDYATETRACALAAGHWCQAVNHHRDCPRRGTREAGFIGHHVQPREYGGSDHRSNLVWVWNGLTTLGRGGCHKLIHDLRRDQYDHRGHLVLLGSESAGLLKIPRQ